MISWFRLAFAPDPWEGTLHTSQPVKHHDGQVLCVRQTKDPIVWPSVTTLDTMALVFQLISCQMAPLFATDGGHRPGTRQTALCVPQGLLRPQNPGEA